MNRKLNKLNADGAFKRSVQTALWAGLAGAAFAPAAFAQDTTTSTTTGSTDATELDTVEVTGSRLGRADIEGALPVATITREDIDRSGFTSVAELLRNTTFNSLGAFRAQSGSSAQSLVAVDLRGLGSERTLVLIDGRRAPKAPFAPSAQDLNAVPIAMVERIEVLKDGASAIYGSDAIAGVINIITRKEFTGVAVNYQKATTDRNGGDSHGGQFVSGIASEKGSLIFGASFFSRDIIFARDSLFNTPGASFFSNNYILGNFVDANDDYFDDNTGNYYYGAVPGGCPNSDPAFYLIGGAVCGYDFNRVAADEAKTGNQGVFVRTMYKIADNWSMNVSGSVSRATSFGRYAPSLNDFPILVPASSPNNPFNDINDGTPGNDQDIYLYHRFAALGPRDNETDANVYDLSGSLTGMFGDFKLTTGVRHNEYAYVEFGRNYVVLPIAEQYIIDGTYDIFDPTAARTAGPPARGNDPAVLNAMKATITRNSKWQTLEYFAEASTPIARLGGGDLATAFGIEWRSENYFDKYDSLQEGGAIGGASGNSSGGPRQVQSAYVEVNMPFIEALEVNLSGRFEDYDDVGENFAPKLAVRYQPIDTITLRGSIGTGFRAPSLDIITALPTYSAESINNDAATCAFAGGTFTNGTCSVQSQVSTIFISNPELKAEESDQYSVGFAMDITQNMDFSIDYYNISLTNRINEVSPQEIIDRLTTGDPIPPGLGVVRQPPSNRIISVTAGYANEGDLDTSGLDFVFHVKQPLGGLGNWDSRFTVAYILDYKIDSGRDLTGDPAYPQYRATLDNSWKLGDLAVAFNGNHIADQAQTVNASGNQIGHIPSYTTWDVQVGYTLPVAAGMELALGALNVFGREPSSRSAYDGRDYNFYLYDQYGQQPYFKITQKF